MRNKYNDKSWYPMAVAISIGVVLYVLLTNLRPVLHGIWHFIGAGCASTKRR